MALLPTVHVQCTLYRVLLHTVFVFLNSITNLWPDNLIGFVVITLNTIVGVYLFMYVTVVWHVHVHVHGHNADFACLYCTWYMPHNALHVYTMYMYVVRLSIGWVNKCSGLHSCMDRLFVSTVWLGCFINFVYREWYSYVVAKRAKRQSETPQQREERRQQDPTAKRAKLQHETPQQKKEQRHQPRP